MWSSSPESPERGAIEIGSNPGGIADARGVEAARVSPSATDCGSPPQTWSIGNATATMAITRAARFVPDRANRSPSCAFRALGPRLREIPSEIIVGSTPSRPRRERRSGPRLAVRWIGDSPRCPVRSRSEKSCQEVVQRARDDPIATRCVVAVVVEEGRTAVLPFGAKYRQ